MWHIADDDVVAADAVNVAVLTMALLLSHWDQIPLFQTPRHTTHECNQEQMLVLQLNLGLPAVVAGIAICK